MTMENDSTRNKDGNDNDRIVISAVSCPPSDVTQRRTSNRRCIELNDVAAKQPTEIGARTPSDVIRQERGKSAERSTSDRCRVSPPRWDGISVWVPNTAATARRAGGGQRRLVQRSRTYTEPSQTATPSPPPPPPPPTTTTTTTVTGNARRLRGTRLLSAAGSTLARAWNRRSTKFIRKAPTSDETSTLRQHDEEGQNSTALTVCRKCHGRISNDSRPVGTATASPTATTGEVAAPVSEFPSPPKRDFETDSGYLVGRATSNSPNDAISCRTLPSTSRDDASPREDDQCYTKRDELVVDRGIHSTSEPISADCGVVRAKDALHPKDLLNWKLSLMDRAEARLTTPTLWDRGSTSSSDEDDDDENEDCSSQATTERDIEDHPCGRNRAQSPKSNFSFENDFERAVEDQPTPTSMTERGKGANCDAAVEEVDDLDLERLFDVKLDELRRTRCDTTPNDQLQCLRVKDDEETLVKQHVLFDATSCGSESRHAFTDDVKVTQRKRPTVPTVVITDLIHDVANSSGVKWNRSSSLPRSTTGARVTAAAVHKASDPLDVDTAPRRSLSYLSDSVPYVDAEGDEDGRAFKAGSVGCRLATSGRSLPRASEPPLNQSITEGQREPSSVATVSLASNRHRDETLSCVADDDDFDDDRRALLTWRQLRSVIDDAAAELADSLLDLTLHRRVDDDQTTPEFRRSDVARLRRRFLRNVRTTLWSGRRLAAGSADTTDNKNDDELQRLTKFVDVLLDCSEVDDVQRITAIKKYIMTCWPAQVEGPGDTVNRRLQRRQRNSGDDKEINVFVLRHGVRIDGLHVSVAGCNDLPVDTMQDTCEYIAVYSPRNWYSWIVNLCAWLCIAHRK